VSRPATVTTATTAAAATRCEVVAGRRYGTSSHHGHGHMARPVRADEDAGSEVSKWERREREEKEAEAEELGAAGELGVGEELPLFLPTSMAPADEE